MNKNPHRHTDNIKTQHKKAPGLGMETSTTYCEVILIFTATGCCSQFHSKNALPFSFPSWFFRLGSPQWVSNFHLILSSQHPSLTHWQNFKPSFTPFINILSSSRPLAWQFWSHYPSHHIVITLPLRQSLASLAVSAKCFKCLFPLMYEFLILPILAAPTENLYMCVCNASSPASWLIQTTQQCCISLMLIINVVMNPIFLKKVFR